MCLIGGGGELNPEDGYTKISTFFCCTSLMCLSVFSINYTAAQHRNSTLCVSRVNTTVKDSFLPFATLTNLSGNL